MRSWLLSDRSSYRSRVHWSWWAFWLPVSHTKMKKAILLLEWLGQVNQKDSPRCETFADTDSGFRALGSPNPMRRAGSILLLCAGFWCGGLITTPVKDQKFHVPSGCLYTLQWQSGVQLLNYLLWSGCKPFLSLSYMNWHFYFSCLSRQYIRISVLLLLPRLQTPWQWKRNICHHPERLPYLAELVSLLIAKRQKVAEVNY